MDVYRIVMRKKIDKQNQKMILFYNLLVKWLNVELSLPSIADFFLKRGYERVIVYGIKELGDLLIKELETSGLCVVCGIDKDARYIIQNIPIIEPDDDIPIADVIIVTAIAAFDEIKNNLEEKTKIPVVSLSEVIDELDSSIL